MLTLKQFCGAKAGSVRVLTIGYAMSACLTKLITITTTVSTTVHLPVFVFKIFCSQVTIQA